MKSEAKHSRAPQGWQLACEGADAPMMLLDSRRRIRHTNPAAQQLLQLPTASVVGKTVDIFGRIEPWKTASQLIHQLLREGQCEPRQVMARSGEDAWSVTVLPVHDGKSSTACLLCAFAVNRQRAAGEELVAQDIMARKLSVLTAGIAHQVKNPLFAISATMDAFERRFSSAQEQGDYFAVIRDSVHRLNELTQQLVDYGNPVPLSLQPFSVDAVIENAIESCASLAAKLKVNVTHTRTSSLPLVLMDLQRMQDVFRYLLEHALYRSPWNSAVTVRSNKGSDANRPVVECVVEDCGVCVPEEDLQSVWEPFFRHQAGAGLGLAIAHSTISQHGARVVVENRADAAGLRFLVRLPTRDLS